MTQPCNATITQPCNATITQPCIGIDKSSVLHGFFSEATNCCHFKVQKMTMPFVVLFSNIYIV
jgi:hypothetical protein